MHILKRCPLTPTLICTAMPMTRITGGTDVKKHPDIFLKKREEEDQEEGEET